MVHFRGVVPARRRNRDAAGRTGRPGISEIQRVDWRPAATFRGPRIQTAARSASAGEFARGFEVTVALHRRTHQETVTLLDDAFGVALLDMRMADHDIVLLAGVDDALHPFQHGFVFVLPGIAEFLRQVAFADQNAADARHVLEHVVEVLDAAGVLDLQNAENLALRVERPDVGLLIIILLRETPITRRGGRAVATNAGRIEMRRAFQSRITAGG